MRHLSVSICVLAFTALPAFAGPDWTEIPDAPKLQPGQFIPFFPVNSIVGTLAGLDALGGPDMVDLYHVRTTSAGFFSTSTTFSPFRDGGGETEFDSVLFLFDLAGFGIVANDDIMPGNHDSIVEVPGPGDYLLAVAVKGIQPFSSEGNIFDIYAMNNQFNQVPPTAMGGAFPLSEWVGPPIFDAGKYVVNFIVPAPGAIAFSSLIAVMSLRRRR